MKIFDFHWDIKTIAKIIDKHNVFPSEVEEVYQLDPLILSGQDLYYALGQTHAGRYLFVVFRKSAKHKIKIISAREMTKTEKKRFKG